MGRVKISVVWVKISLVWVWIIEVILASSYETGNKQIFRCLDICIFAWCQKYILHCRQIFLCNFNKYNCNFAEEIWNWQKRLVFVALRDVTLNFKIKGRVKRHKAQFSFWEVLKVSESEEKTFNLLLVKSFEKSFPITKRFKTGLLVQLSKEELSNKIKNCGLLLKRRRGGGLKNENNILGVKMA